MAKRFIAYDIVKTLEQQKENILLGRLQKTVKPTDKKEVKNMKYGKNHLM
jgi:hypothetical protein